MTTSKLGLLVIAAFASVLLAPAARAQLADDEAKALLDQHNVWRARFNMAALEWDDDVAGVAQEWADQLAASGSFAHRQDGQYGENLWGGTAGRFSMTSVVDAWGSEQANYNMNAKSCAPGKVCGHFTQVVWWNTTKLGCGKATGANGNDVVVCNYDPPGNFTGESPFGKEPPSHRF